MMELKYPYCVLACMYLFCLTIAIGHPLHEKKSVAPLVCRNIANTSFKLCRTTNVENRRPWPSRLQIPSQLSSMQTTSNQQPLLLSPEIFKHIFNRHFELDGLPSSTHFLIDTDSSESSENVYMDNKDDIAKRTFDSLSYGNGLGGFK